MRKSTAILLLLPLIFPACEKWEFEQREFLQVTLAPPTGITFDVVELQGAIADLQEKDVMEHGFLWSQSNPVPTTTDFDGIASLGLRRENGAFTARVGGLSLGERYFFRAYALVDDRAFYSEPIAYTGASGNAETIGYAYHGARILTLTGTVGGFDLGIDGVEHGFVWSFDTQEPTLDDNTIGLGNWNSEAPFSYNLENVAAYGRLFHFRCFGIMRGNSRLDTIYGETLTFDGKGMYEIWEPIPSLGWENRRTEGSGFSINGKGYVTAGYVPDDEQGNYFRVDTWEYDPETDNWTRKADFPGGPRKRTNCFVIDGLAYVGGGEDFEGDRYYDPQFKNDFYRYDPVNDRWSPIASLPPLRSPSAAASFALNGRGYLVGGDTREGIVATVWEYDPEFDEWTEKAYPIPGERSGAVAFVIAGKAYIGTGQANLGLVSDLWAYDPEGDSGAGSWERRAGFPNGERKNAVAVALNGKGYLATGEGAGFFWRDFWEYDPERNLWSRKVDNTDGEVMTSAVAFPIGTDIYVGAGGNLGSPLDNFYKYITE